MAYVRRDGVLPDVIECQEYAALPYYLIQRRLVERHLLSDVPLVLHLHSPDFCITRANRRPRHRLPGYWVGRMERFCMLAAEGILSPSAFLARQVAGEMPQRANAIEVIPYPYVSLPASATMPQHGDLVFAGRLEPRKGVLELVEVCDHLWSRGREFRLTLVGGDTPFGPRGVSVGAWLRWRYRRRIESGLLTIYGAALAPEALWQRLERAWAVIVPSVWENYPNVCIEAMSLGKLVIASTSGGQAEMIGTDGDSGILFSWEKPGDCASAIEQALSLSVEQVQTIGARARERITALTSFEAVLPQRLAHFERVIADRHPRRTFPSLMPEMRTSPPSVVADIVPGLLSVVVPYYNLGAYLAETIASIVAASYRPLEIVVIDDGMPATRRRHSVSPRTVSRTGRRLFPRLIVERLMAEVGVVQFGIVSASGQQLVMGSFLDNASLFQHNDPVGSAHGRKAVRNDDTRSPLHHDVQPFLHLGFGKWIDTCRCFIENED